MQIYNTTGLVNTDESYNRNFQRYDIHGAGEAAVSRVERAQLYRTACDASTARCTDTAPLDKHSDSVNYMECRPYSTVTPYLHLLI